ncbi:MAG: hypothetical protein A4E29_00455 [Methanomassiliicoccales archaeon PtaB.Bin134]|nr:MAG: hypothetical protein A4E29_00455 [Methanomassiliicoccales archaeon PtaB.Bin134]
MLCPDCGKEMEPGFIWTNGPYLYWTERIRLYIDGDRLNGGSWLTGARLPGFRCPECKLLMARYSSNDEMARELFSLNPREGQPVSPKWPSGGD